MRIGLLLTAALVIVQALAGDGGWAARLEALTLDGRFLLRGVQPVSGEVLVLLADDASVERLGRWPWPRRRMAELMDRLAALGPDLVAFDLLFPEAEPDPGGDAAFAQSIARFGRVVLAAYGEFGGESTPLPAPERIVRPIPALADAAAALGHVNLFPDAAGRPSREALVLRDGDNLLPSLALAVARLRLGIAEEPLRLEPGLGLDLDGEWIATDGALRMPVNYLGPSGTIDTAPLTDLWSGRLEAGRVRGRVVLVGAAVTGLGDRFPTPYDDALAGVERHAMLVDTLLTARLLRQDAVTRLGDLGVTALAGLVASALAGLPPVAALAALTGWALAVAGAIHAAFALEGLVLGMAFPLAAVLLPGGAVMAQAFRRSRAEGRRIREAFAQYLHPDLVENLVRHPEALRPGGEERVLTVLFSDIRGFTGLSERLPPDRLIAFLGAYLEAMTAEIRRHGGYVDKFIGDGILAVFGAPVARAEPALDACRCALAMQAAVAAGAERWRDLGVDPLRVGIGVHTGPMVIGNVGGAGRLNYTVLGDAVNVGARLESATKAAGADILISDATHRLVAERLAAEGMAARPLGPLSLPGRAVPVAAWALTGRRS
ncbi:CHASE2 domain-containing protein [Azospirillum rugosum]|uniref:Adenylate cyclase n=1 Tax=Azospirillum rugosum TaxID=416170 RepID=A0ABS4SVJ2_9PROT|nr:adenylate/guanylate cyclase domain-containing protein [Azospirillum rugosum]MBP2296579.1 adenylate cyclase [Azospirillum rugosum]MDQ0530021.1 adenylate cyclase [Azospirillum rugosum]